MDDMGGRIEAKRLHFKVTGTLGVSQAAANNELVDLKDAVAKLRRTNFHISYELLDKLINDAEG